MTHHTDIKFTPNTNVKDRDDQFITIHVTLAAVVQSWKTSVFSFEWLSPDGEIKAMNALTPAEQEKRREIEHALEHKAPIEMPVLGIGILDNVEIGSGRAALLTLADKGVTEMPVHIPKSCESEFQPFRTQNP